MPNDISAFPSRQFVGGHLDTVEVPGMSLRDYFAGQALANSTLMSFSGWEVGNEYDAARVAYAIASAMIAERAK